MGSPAGVGFSYSDTKSDYHTNDTKTANDNLLALLDFFEKFPEMKRKRFFLSGESYAGHYVPELAQAILKHNEQADESRSILLEGFAVGNPLTEEKEDFNAPMRFFNGPSMISPGLYEKAYKACGGDFTNPAKACQDVQGKAMKLVGNIDAYDIMEDVCLKHTQTRQATQQFRIVSQILALGQQTLVPFTLRRTSSGRSARITSSTTSLK